MNDMRPTIEPKSDQLNGDSLLAGPINITITRVDIRAGTEQPISIFYSGDDGKPWKPCKSMARVLVSAWGPDASKYVGRSLTLYRDPTVTWGAVQVGGLRISHLSDIDTAMTMALTITKGSKKPFTVKPLTVEKPPTKSAPTFDPATETAFLGILDRAETLDGLTKTWKANAREIATWPADVQARITARKDERKAELSEHTA